MRWLSALVLVLVGLAGSVQAVTPDPFAQTSKWNVQESWTKTELVYTFKPDGTFVSSDWAGGKGQGIWSRNGDQLVMIWSRHDNAFYRGTIIGSEVRGVAYFKDGKKMGTFLFRLIRQPG
jgi:hypothetical protein